MAKLAKRFHANFLRITNVYEQQKGVNVTNQKQKDGTGVPLMPRMVFNRDGSPCYKHLEEKPPTETKKVKGQGKVESYPMPKINWKEC